MLIIISPAKRMDFTGNGQNDIHSEIRFPEETSRLINHMKKFSINKLKSLMEISDELARLNYERYQNWIPDINPPDSRQAILAFHGDVYQGMDVKTFKRTDFVFAQEHLRILSGLYGLLRPMDRIRPYRLEMGTVLKIGKIPDLYAFWMNKITDALIDEPAFNKDRILINLASNEYFRVIDEKKLKGRIITPVFKDFHNDQYKILQFFTKKARGMMASFLIRNKIKQPEHLKLFNEGGYQFNPHFSGVNQWIFTRG